MCDMTKTEILNLASEVGLRTIDEPHYLIEFFNLAYAAGQAHEREEAAKELEAMVFSGETSISEVSFAVQYLRGEK